MKKLSIFSKGSDYRECNSFAIRVPRVSLLIKNRLRTLFWRFGQMMGNYPIGFGLT